MSSRGCLVLAALAFGAAAPVAAADDAVAQAQKTFQKQMKQSEKDLKECLKTALAEFRLTLKELREGVAAGDIDPLEALDFAGVAAALYAVHLDEHMAYVTNQLCGLGTSLIQQLGQTPAGFKAGDCGTWDQFLHTADQLYGLFGEKGLKKFKQFAQQMKAILEAGGEVEIDINVHIAVTLPPPPPAPGPVAPPPPPPLRFKSLSSAGHGQTPNDGKLSVRGLGPKNGTVTVNIQGPNGTNITKTVNTDADGCFAAFFPSPPDEAPPGDLPEGNYKITLTSGAQSVSKMHGV